MFSSALRRVWNRIVMSPWHTHNTVLFLVPSALEGFFQNINIIRFFFCTRAFRLRACGVICLDGFGVEISSLRRAWCCLPPTLKIDCNADLGDMQRWLAQEFQRPGSLIRTVKTCVYWPAKKKAEILLRRVTWLWQTYYNIKALSQFHISNCSGQNGRGIPSREYDIILLKKLFIQYYLLFISLLGLLLVYINSEWRDQPFQQTGCLLSRLVTFKTHFQVSFLTKHIFYIRRFNSLFN